jgi:hypothetical protein
VYTEVSKIEVLAFVARNKPAKELTGERRKGLDTQKARRLNAWEDARDMNKAIPKCTSKYLLPHPVHLVVFLAVWQYTSNCK